ncbi:autophagy-related protein 22-like protein [Phakopsora pachyrhizi]|uniref:Autophagy-related protein n=1 Tax=Phakopsora pachyrhizi TaxID=170000 RepID=A0AAV0BS13_PHAPC|nr:autophagy-related protein 22-like protein [Phakopsora pachyrhizi]
MSQYGVEREETGEGDGQSEEGKKEFSDLSTRGTIDENYYVDEDEDELNRLIDLSKPTSEPTDIHHQHPNNPQELGGTSHSLWGFYTYSFASEVFSIVSSTLFLPITLEQFARDNGYLYPGLREPCPGSFRLKNSTLSINSTTRFLNDIQISLFGKWFDTTSFPLYVFSLSVAFQACVVASMGDTADDVIMRKVLLVSFAGIGSLAGSMFFVLDSDSILWTLTALLTMITNVALGASLVCLNSYIPTLAKTEVDLIKRRTVTIAGTAEGVEEGDEDDEVNKAMISKVTASISAKGIAIGYFSGILTLSISLILINSRDGDTNSLRWTIGASSIWWGLFTIPACILLEPRKFLIKRRILNPFRPRSGLIKILKMLKEYERLKDTIRFLLAWFLLSDAFSTITSTAILFAKTNLKMKPSHLILIGIITPLTGILGSMIIGPKLLNFFNRSINFYFNDKPNHHLLKIIVILSCFIPGYVSTSVLIKKFNVLSTEIEMYILSGIFGFFYGAFQAYSRAVYSELIPIGQEAKWYALYSITDKSSSFFGPFIVGLIIDFTHNIRYGFLFILIIMLVSIPILNSIDFDQGKINARRFIAL